MNTKYPTQGFTLIELIIVIAIIGIIASLAIPNIIASQQRANDIAAQGCGNALLRATRIYRIDHPTTVEVPSVSELYGTAEKDEFYGTNACSALMQTTGSVITGNPSPDGQFAFTVKHAAGKNTYLVTTFGLGLQP